MVRLTHSGKKAFQEFEKNFQILEKPQATETLELCSYHLVNMTRPGNISKALAIRIEIGDRDGEATYYLILGTLFQ